ncbi:hypothetical protein ACHHV8_01200 [Paenibacillus sp. TAB 01]|uniref:hypothetical protein n=1 Tax=Paenibacillus sp. TAB 01 TaxID=3368988 RepID=UPI003750B831
MATILLDQRTSQNISTTIPDADPFPANTPVLVAQVGLIVPPTTPGVIRAQFDGIIGVEVVRKHHHKHKHEGTFFTVTLVRGTELTDLVVYSSLVFFGPDERLNKLVPISAADFDIPAPASGQLTYTLFAEASSNRLLRSGPESFHASVYTG